MASVIGNAVFGLLSMHPIEFLIYYFKVLVLTISVGRQAEDADSGGGEHADG